METLIQTARIYSQDIGMEFSIEKCAMLVMKSRKRHMSDESNLHINKKNRTLGEKKTYKYLGILEAGTIKQMEMKDKIKKRIFPENQKATQDKTISGTLSKG